MASARLSRSSAEIMCLPAPRSAAAAGRAAAARKPAASAAEAPAPSAPAPPQSRTGRDPAAASGPVALGPKITSHRAQNQDDHDDHHDDMQKRDRHRRVVV